MSCNQNNYPDYDSQSCNNQSCLGSQASLQSVPSLTLLPHHHEHLSSTTIFRCLTTFQGHNSYISCLTLARKFLYSGSSDTEIRVWNRNPLDLEVDYYHKVSNNVVAAGKGSVKSIVFMADKLFSAHQDHKIRVWKINTHELTDHCQQAKYMRVATLPTLSERASKILQPKNQVQIRRNKTCTWICHVDTVSALALSKDESLLYSVSWDKTLKIWRTKDFKCLESVTNAHEDAINALALSKDGDVYTGSADKKIKIWRKYTGDKKHSLITTLEKHKTGINALALNSDELVLYSGASDRSIVVWEKDDGGNYMVVKGALRGHTQSILCLTVVSDLLCSGSADKTIRIWREIERSYSCIAVLEGHQGPVKCLSATIDSQSQSETACLVYSGSLDCNIKAWQVKVPNL